MRRGWFLFWVAVSMAAAGDACAAQAADQSAADAAEVTEWAGISHGLLVILGAEPLELPITLARSGKFLVHALAESDETLHSLQNAAQAQQLDIRRLIAERQPFSPLPYANGMVDAVLCPAHAGDADVSKVFSEVWRVLRPGGVFLIHGADSAALACRHAAEQAGFEPLQTKEHRSGSWLRATKPYPKGADNWPQWEHGPDNNPVSSDTLVHAPYRTQWLAQPYYIAMPAVTTAAGGRTFLAMGHIAHHEREEPWLNTLLARNGYNGMELWRRSLPDGYMVHRSAFIATPEAFYMIQPDGEGCLLLDPETGEEMDRVRLEEVPGQWKWIALDGHTLFAMIGKQPDPRETTIVRSTQPAWSWGELSAGYYTATVPWGFGETVVAYDLKNRRVSWRHEEDSRIDSRAMALGPDRVFVYAPDTRLCALRKDTGTIIWANDDAEVRKLIEEPGRGLTSTPGFRSTCFCVYTPEALVFTPQTNMNVVAVSPENGNLLWHRPKTTSNPNALFTEGKLYVGIGQDGNTLALDALTGETRQDLGFRKRSCARLTATPEALFCRGYPEGLTRFDRTSSRVFFDGSMRPACNDGVIAANGLLYIGPWLCDCNLTIMGTVAWGSAEGFEPEAVCGERTLAPAVDITPDPLTVSNRDWYGYRGDNDRSGSTKVPVSRVLFPLLRYAAPAACGFTAPVAANGQVFIAGEDGKVRSIDAQTGLEQWSFASNGPIMQPPSLWRGRVFFGSGDGYVYALEVNTGKLLWKFRAAPVERRILMYGALCSTWPVNSGVLVHDSVAYFAAGLIDYDGTYVYAVNAETGELIWANNTSGHLDKTLRKGVSAQGNLAVCGGYLWMAGGNVISPAPYRLDTGVYAGPLPKDGSPETNRGEEVGVFLDQGLVMGGRLRYSAADNVVNPGQFILAKCDKPDAVSGPAFSAGQVVPAWDKQLAIAMPGREAPPAAYDSQAMAAMVSGTTRSLPKRLWAANGFEGRRVDALALAPDAVVLVCRTPVPRTLQPQYHLCLLNRDDGAIIFQQELPGEPRLNGLAIDRDGRVLVALADGGIAAYGALETLRKSVMKLAEVSRSGALEPAQVSERLRAALEKVHDPEGRRFLLASLKEQGLDLSAAGQQTGAVTQWRLLGPVPWNAADCPTDTVLIGEPEVEIGKTYAIEGKQLSWREYVSADSRGKVDLAGIYGDHENAAAYAYAEVILPGEGEYQLKIGSNDGFKCWFNGREAARFDQGRLYAPDQTIVTVHAKTGVNRLLLKITQMGGGWAFGVRFGGADGAAIPLRQ